MKIETKYSIDDRVVIPDLENAKAVINQICIGRIGTTYEVRWFHNGDLKSGWLTEDQIRIAERY